MRHNRGVLKPAELPLTQTFDLVALDLDGVVYVGPDAVPGAAGHLERAVRDGAALAYVTNNASKTPEQVSEKLTRMGIRAAPADVVTSAQAAARLLATKLPEAAEVFLLGGAGLEAALRDQGLVPVSTPTADVAAVVQGFGPDMAWKQVLAGAVLVDKGLLWVASNTDMTFPTIDGLAPGNGALVKLVADFAGREPFVAGKPQPPLFEETLVRVGGKVPLMVGDRLDTDIEGARNIGWDSLLVFTGVTGLAELVAAQPRQRPTYLGMDLQALHEPHRIPERSGAEWRCGGWVSTVDEGRLACAGSGEPVDWWRSVAMAAWDHLDRSGEPVLIDDVVAPR